MIKSHNLGADFHSPFETSIRIQQRGTQWCLSDSSLAIHFSYTMFLPYLFGPRTSTAAYSLPRWDLW